ncbi:ABC transporter substrate-binding protein [Catenuloplanes atrovinosus]|uniref:NitT/TauT family transport system substrate-binding protein n=1 Tax=Catenuloplanes atrovinosus TaxID=137266 RepID=A0AAE4C948_9ACTN|nr:ABC transporter substrate-binding protein [Catenuloplanes atrovinosus]MDR7275367.1 NitT/TauT family transport system substrate-binding protein [Catenuloplanes atrovinosus]
MIRIRACVTAATLLALAGCGLLGEEPVADRAGTTAITVSVMPTIDLAPFHLAMRNGYFTAEGLAVTTVGAPSGQASVAKLIGGDVDIAYSSYPPFFVAQARGAADLRLVADASAAGPRTTMVVAMPDSPVKGIADLAGRRVAVTGRNTVSDMLVKSAMRTAGADFSGVRWVEIPFPDTAAALERGDVDAAFLTEPFITQARRTVGAVPVADTAVGPARDLPTAGYAALRTFTDAHPDAVTAFRRAMERATAEAADRAVVEPLIVEFAKVDPAVAAETEMLTLRSRIEPATLQRVPNLLAEYGIIPAPLDVTGMIA